MKKSVKICAILVFMMTVLICTISAHADDTVKFSQVQEYNGTVYTSLATRTCGEINADILKPLPARLTNHGFIYCFAIYYDKIYYMTGAQGSDGVRGYIYSCNLDGSDNVLIADNADGLAECYISDGCIFYDVAPPYYELGFPGGIMKINLNTGWYGRIVTDENASLVKIVGEYMFYYVDGSYYRMTCAGAYAGMIAEGDIEVQADVIKGATAYKAYGGALYAYDWNWNSRWISNCLNNIEGLKAYSDYAYIVNVTGGYVYYSMGYRNPSLQYKTVPNTVLVRVPESGGTGDIIARWYIS